MLDNHYHIMADAPADASTLSRVMNNFHRFSALWIKKNSKCSVGTDRIWANYRDTCITYERSYFTRLNYIWFNPVKHRYVEKTEEWRFGSYYYRIKKEQDLNDIIHEYPFDRIKIEDDF